MFCIYYINCSINECCTLGVNYRKLTDPANFGYGWMEKLPCYSSNKTPVICDKRRFDSKLICKCGWSGSDVEEFYSGHAYNFVCPECKQPIHKSCIVAGVEMLIPTICIQHVEKIELLVKQIQEENRHQRKSINAIIDCPVCGEEVFYTYNWTNHHTSGRCRTKECISWRE